jgi:phosphate transport system protein
VTPDPLPRQLTDLNLLLADMAPAAAAAMQHATTALLEGRERLAHQVITGDAEIDALRAQVEEVATDALLFHAPVAGDLRRVVSAIRSAGDIERMGDLALHVAQAARRRHPQPVLPAEVAPYFAEMGRIGAALARKAADVMRTRDVETAATLEADDDAMDDLHRHIFSVLMAPSWAHGVGPAVDITLLGRFYERYADHAVTVARRVVYVVTGRMPGSLAV